MNDTAVSRVLTLVFTDLADSTALKTARGDVAVGELIARHREHVTRLAGECSGRIIDWAGDGCFLTFETSSAGVLFGLRLQQAHADDAELPGVRVGIHMGEVTEKLLPSHGTEAPPVAHGRDAHATESQRIHVEGLAVDIAARICGLAKPGQVLMSSAVYDSARQRIGVDALGKPILWQAHGTYALKGFDKAVEIGEAGLEGLSLLEAPRTGDKARLVKRAKQARVKSAKGERRPMPRGWVAAALVAVAAVVLIVVGSGDTGPSDTRANPPAPATSPERPDSIAVMYFENLSDPTDPENLEATLASLLTFELSSSDTLEVLPRQRLYDIGKQMGIGPDEDIDRNVATDIATRAEVATMVVGTIAEAGEQLRVGCELIDVASARILDAFQASGTEDELFNMAELLGEDVRRYLRHETDETALTERLTDSVPAFKAYVRGETYLHRLQFYEADREFRRAVELDPDFAQAHFWRAVGQTWLEKDAPVPMARRAVELIDHFPRSYRTTVEAALRYFEGDWTDAVELLNAALDTDRENKEALYFLSEIYFHSEELRDYEKAVELMEHVRRLDPEFDLVLDHLAECYAILNEQEKFEGLVQLGERKNLAIMNVAQAGWAMMHGDSDEAVQILSDAPGTNALGYLTRYALGTGQFELAVAAFDEASRDDRTSPYQIKLSRALIAECTGQFEEALRAWTEFAPDEAVAAGTLGGYRGEDFVWSRIRRAELFHLNGAFGRAQSEAAEAAAVYPNSYPALGAAGHYALENDDARAADTFLRRAAELSLRSPTPHYAYHVDILEAELKLKEEDYAGARDLLLGALEAQKDRKWEPLIRGLLSRAYVGLGDVERAAEALENMRPAYWGGSAGADWIRPLYTLGKLKLQLRDREAARGNLTRFLEFWGEADWELDEVEEAKLLVQELGREDL